LKAWRHNESTRIHLNTAAKLSNKPGPAHEFTFKDKISYWKLQLLRNKGE